MGQTETVAFHDWSGESRGDAGWLWYEMQSFFLSTWVLKQAPEMKSDFF
jgi:hypothetical protein